MRARWGVLALCAAVAAVVVAWLLSPVGPPPTVAPTGEAAPREAPPLPGLAAHPTQPTPPAAASSGSLPAGFDPRPLDCRIEGTVRKDGKPASARVELYVLGDRDIGLAIASLRSAPLATTEAGEDGRFAFPGIAKDAYRVRAVDAGGAEASASAWVRSPGARVSVDMMLGDARETLTGRVVHEDGSPCQGDVLVVGVDEHWSRDPLGVAATDSNGFFSVGSLPARRVFGMAVSAAGSSAFGRLVTLPFRDEYRIVWEADRAWIGGRVVAAADGSPILAAEVTGRVDWDEDEGPTDRVQSGEGGRFRVLVPREHGAIQARAPGYVGGFSAVASGATEVEIRMHRQARIHGIVRRRGDGRLVGGVQVLALPVQEGTDGQPRPLTTRADADGRFAFEALYAGAYLILARGDGQVAAPYLPTEAATRRSATVTVGACDDCEVVIETVPAARVVGVVTAEDGSAIEGARVVVHRKIWGRSKEADELPWEAYPMEILYAGRGGAYEATLVPDIEYVVEASAPGRLSSLPEDARATGGATVRVDLVLPAGRWVEVTVLEEGADTPVSGARVRALTDNGSIGHDTAEGHTDAAGRVRLGPLRPGDLAVWVEAEGFEKSNVSHSATVIEGPDGPKATIRIHRASRVAGRVLLPTGEPAVGATVWLTTATGPDHASGTSETTGPDGSFAFEDLGPAERTIRAKIEVEGLVSETLPAPTGAVGLTLHLALRGVVARVLDPDGKPVASATAHYGFDYPTGGGAVHPGEVKDGRVVIDLDEWSEVASITGVLTIDGAADGLGQRLPLGPAKVEGVRPGLEAVVRLPREKTIEGQVIGPDGRGVAGVRMRAEAVNDEQSSQRASLETPWTWSLRNADFVRTDERGAFRLGYLGEGPHWVAALPPPTFAPPPTLRVEAGSTSVDFRLQGAVKVTVTVLGPDGRPVEGAQVVALRRAGQDFLLSNLFTEYRHGWSVAATTLADGRARMEGFDAQASFALGVRGPASREFADVVREKWSPADTTIRLATGLSLSGTARDAAGTPLHGAYVECLVSDGVSRTVVTGKDGTFRFTGLPAGSVRLEGRFDDGPGVAAKRALRGAVSVRAGAEDVDLRLR